MDGNLVIILMSTYADSVRNSPASVKTSRLFAASVTVSLSPVKMTTRTYSSRQLQRLAHELRKPLTVIRGLLSSCDSKLTFKKLSQEIDAEVSRAAKMLDEMTANAKKTKQ